MRTARIGRLTALALLAAAPWSRGYNLFSSEGGKKRRRRTGKPKSWSGDPKSTSGGTTPKSSEKSSKSKSGCPKSKKGKKGKGKKKGEKTREDDECDTTTTTTAAGDDGLCDLDPNEDLTQVNSTRIIVLKVPCDFDLTGFLSFQEEFESEYACAFQESYNDLACDDETEELYRRIYRTRVEVVEIDSGNCEVGGFSTSSTTSSFDEFRRRLPRGNRSANIVLEVTSDSDCPTDSGCESEDEPLFEEEVNSGRRRRDRDRRRLEVESTSTSSPISDLCSKKPNLWNVKRDALEMVQEDNPDVPWLPDVCDGCISLETGECVGPPPAGVTVTWSYEAKYTFACGTDITAVLLAEIGCSFVEAYNNVACDDPTDEDFRNIWGRTITVLDVEEIGCDSSTPAPGRQLDTNDGCVSATVRQAGGSDCPTDSGCPSEDEPLFDDALDRRLEDEINLQRKLQAVTTSSSECRRPTRLEISEEIGPILEVVLPDTPTQTCDACTPNPGEGNSEINPNCISEPDDERGCPETLYDGCGCNDFPPGSCAEFRFECTTLGSCTNFVPGEPPCTEAKFEECCCEDLLDDCTFLGTCADWEPSGDDDSQCGKDNLKTCCPNDVPCEFLFPECGDDCADVDVSEGICTESNFERCCTTSSTTPGGPLFLCEDLFPTCGPNCAFAEASGEGICTIPNLELCCGRRVRKL